MAVTVSAALLSGSPAPVQVVVTGVPVGEPFEVRGQLGMDSWSVPGGRGVGDGSQVVLVDSRAPLRSAVTYTVTTSEDRVYAWSGTPGASPSTKTTAAGTVTNLAINPSFEGTAGTVEVARNHNPSPLFSEGSPGWSVIGRVSKTEIPGVGVALTFAATVPAANQVFTRDFSAPVLGEGDLISSLFTVSIPDSASRSVPVRARIRINRTGGQPVVWASGPAVTIAPGGSHEFLFTYVAPVDSGSFSVAVMGDSTQPLDVEDELIVHDGWTVQVNGYQIDAPIVPGDTSPDPDLPSSWTGPVNNSPSVLTGKRVAGTGVGWQSKQWAASGVASHYIPAGSVQDYVISVGESFQIRPRNAGQTYILNGDPRVTTDHPIHVNGPAMIETGQGWWDNLMIVEGEYTGGYFDGNTVSGVVPVSATSTPVTVPYPEKYVIQSLDGRQKVDFVWRDNGMPRDPYIDNAAFAVPGRRRPPVRFAPGGDGTGSLEVRVDRVNGETLHEMLMAGRPMVVRTDGNVRDLKAVDVVMITAAPNVLFEGDGGLSTQRVWSLSYLLVGDPEPDAVLGAATWDQFDEIYAAQTWDQFDAEWATQTWDQFDREDWAQRL